MADAETLQRTPLYERHVAAGARLVPFAGWEMPVQYARHPRRARRRARAAPASSTSRTWAQVGTSGPGALALLQRLLSNDVERIAGRRRAVLPAVPRGRRRARRPLHLPAGRGPLPDGHQRRQPRARPRLVRRARGGLRRDGRPTGSPTSRCSPSRARGRAGARRRARRRRAPAPLHGRADDRRRRPRRARLRHGLHGRGRRGAADRARRRGRRLGRGRAPAAPSPSGWARATRCASRPASTSTATTCPRTATRSRPAWAGAARRTTGFIGAEPVAAAREHGHGGEARPLRDHRPGHRPPGQPGGRRRRRHLAARSRRRSGYGIGLAYLPAERAAPGTPFEIDVRGKTRAAPKSDPSHSSRRSAELADASYPSDLSYHEEHDWARIEGDTATFGITWYAQDAARRGRLLRPAEGRRDGAPRATRTPRSSPSRRSPT